MQKITPFLWFDNQAEEAMNYYVSIFSKIDPENTKVLGVSRYENAGPGQNETVMTASFKLCGQEFTALNGGPHFKFNESVSFVVDCKSQEEVDYYWEKLTSDGGEESMCGWLKDKYGLSWQITPTVLIEMIGDKNSEKSQRVMNAMLKMKKIDINELQRAYKGK